MTDELKFMKVTRAEVDGDNFAVLRIQASNDVKLWMPCVTGSFNRYRDVRAALRVWIRERYRMEQNKNVLQVVDEDELWPESLPTLE